MAPERRVCDQDVRDRVTSDLGTTFLLEASAGTGKTRVLVDRYVRCVLDGERGSGDVRAVAAITFTEKAAGELRQRIREEFEQRALALTAGSEEAATVQRALDALDDAPISTIHGFAGRLLREFPVEAGIDPAFEQLDQLAGDIERGRLWDEWLTELAAGDEREVSPARAWLTRLLRAGVRLDALRELAIGAKGVFGERYDVDPASAPSGEPDLARGLSGLAGPLEQLREFCLAACGDQGDKGYCAAMELVEAGGRLLAEPPAGLDQLAAALFALPAKASATAPGGARGNWDAVLGGKDELQRCYQAAVCEIATLVDAYAEFLTGLAVAVGDSFARWAGAAQLALGRLDFTDLLGCLRDLLVRDRAARRALQGRFRYLLVDEFQDTDPLQAEIVFFLAEREPRADDWRRIVLEPGKLFVVGDPKQSIYRFRRADIAMYDEAKRLVRGQPRGRGAVEVIRQNFRTTPAVARWVNSVFAGVFDRDREEGRQPGYEAVEPFRPVVDPARVAVLLGRLYDGTAGETDAARRDEARAVAALLVAMRGAEAERWRVQERDARDDAEVRRRPRWGDVALLFRATTGLETYEQALREAGVPYRVDGGKTYFARREVADILLCLRAVDDLSDGPALYGALHSTLFGFSDDDLFLFWAAGGRFDPYAGEQPPGHEAVTAALHALRQLHERRADLEPHEMVTELVRTARGAEFLAATGPGAAQAIANLDKLIELARAFAGAGGGGLGAFLAWAAEADDAAGEQESQVDDEGDVVRLLTIHKAKGLEFPIVVLIGGALAGGGRGGEPIVDRAARGLRVRLKAALPGAAERDVEPQAYVALREREKLMEASEMRRLLYVATTRARDHLVLSCFGKLATQKGEPASGVLLGPIHTDLPTPVRITEEYEDAGLLVLPPQAPPVRDGRDDSPDVAALLAGREKWRERRSELLARAARPAPVTSPSALEHIDDGVRAGGPGAPSGRARALALGSAVHRVMELCDLVDESSLARVAEAAAIEAERPELASEAAALAGACWRAAPVRAAAACDPDSVFRELPVGALVDGAGVNGAIDLLYSDGDAWVIVDFKTDGDADAGVLRERYAPQGAAYAVAVEAATGGVVREIAFIAAAAGGLVVTVPVDDALRDLARREIGAAAFAGRAVAPDEVSPSS